ALRDSVRRRVTEMLPDVPPLAIVLNATHTHTAPEIDDRNTAFELPPGLDLGAMEPLAYVAFAADRIADAVRTAWMSRAPGGVSWGLTQAVVGHNRRWSSF